MGSTRVTARDAWPLLTRGRRSDSHHSVRRCPGNSSLLVQGSRIAAVVDWGNALYGDWLYDAAWLIFWWPWFPQWQGIDITAELEQHWELHGGLPPGLHRRLRARLVHIGLDAMAYNAYRGRWDDLACTASQIQSWPGNRTNARRPTVC